MSSGCTGGGSPSPGLGGGGPGYLRFSGWKMSSSMLRWYSSLHPGFISRGYPFLFLEEGGERGLRDLGAAGGWEVLFLGLSGEVCRPFETGVSRRRDPLLLGARGDPGGVLSS